MQQPWTYTLYMVLVTLLMTSCVTKKACDRKFPFVEHDSTSIVSNTVTIYRDTTVYIKLPGDTVYESIPIGEGVSQLKTPMAKSFAWVKDGRLLHRVEEKDTVLSSKIRGLKSIHSTLEKDKIVYKAVEVRNLRFWEKLWIWIGRGCLGFLLLLAIWIVVYRFK